jgi:hypothetical protein
MITMSAMQPPYASCAVAWERDGQGFDMTRLGGAALFVAAKLLLAVAGARAPARPATA